MRSTYTSLLREAAANFDQLAKVFSIRRTDHHALPIEELQKLGPLQLASALGAASQLQRTLTQITGLRMLVMPKYGAQFRVEGSFHDVLALVDEFDPASPSRTLTNDAEQVITRLHEAGMIGTRRVIYRDTDSNWDEIVVEDGRFARFEPIQAKSLEEALRLIRGNP